MFSIKQIIKDFFQEQRKPVFSLWEVVGKIVLFIAIVTCIGLPITNLFGFAVLFVSGLLIVNGKVKLTVKRFAVVCAIVLIVVLIKGILPRAALEEGHNVFITKQDGEPLERGLPPEVFAYMKQLFLKRYPLEKRCNPKDGTCWLAQPVPKSVFAFSADSIFSKPKYSRIVDNINFSNLSQFRGGFTNDFAYNWYLSSDVKRESMPYFVMYELSPSSVNSSLCWRGHVLRETSPNRFEPIYHTKETCRKITNEDVGRRVFGISINNNPQLGFWDRLAIWKLKWHEFLHPRKNVLPESGTEQLAMRLQLSPILKAAAAIRNFLIIMGIFALVWLMVKVRGKALILPVVIILIATTVVAFYCPHLFGEYYIHEGGEDGSTHQTYGRRILSNAMAGNWRMALRGEQDIYMDTPGFRYFRALEKFVFGDTNFGNLIIILLMPYVFYLLLTHFIPRTWAFWTTIVFLWGLFPFRPSAILGSFGFAYHLYVMIARGGWPGAVAFTAFLTALWLLIKYHRTRGGTYLWYGFIGHFLLFVTVFMRPNFSVACLILVLYFAGRLARERRFKEIAFTWIGFAPVLLMSLHNYWFGRKFYLFTGAASWALTMPPSIYLQAFKEILTFNFNGDNINQIVSHIKIMIGPWYRLAALLPVFFAAFSKRNVSANLRLLAIAVLCLHGVNLFLFAVYWRYVFLTWALTVIVTLSLIWLWVDSTRRRTKTKTNSC